MYNAKKRRTRAFQWRDEHGKYIYSKTVEVDGWRIGTTDSVQVRGARFADGAWPVAKRGQLLGKINEFIWLRNKVTIPKDFAGGEVLLHMDIEAEGALFGQRALVFVDGVETVGLDRLHKDVPFAKRAKGGEKLTIAAEVYTGTGGEFHDTGIRQAKKLSLEDKARHDGAPAREPGRHTNCTRTLRRRLTYSTRRKKARGQRRRFWRR